MQELKRDRVGSFSFQITESAKAEVRDRQSKSVNFPVDTKLARGLTWMERNFLLSGDRCTGRHV